MLERQDVVFAQTLDIADLESYFSGHVEGMDDRLQLTVGKDVLQAEIDPYWPRITWPESNTVVQVSAARSQAFMDLAEKRGQLAVADMFCHANARGLVEHPALLEFSVVAQLDPHAVCKACALNRLLRCISLFPGESDPHGFNAIVGCRMDQQAAPAATKVHESLTRLEAKFTADVVQFSFLSGIEILVGIGKVSTRVL